MSSPANQIRVAMRDRYYNEHCQIQEAAMQAGLYLLPSYPDRNTLTVIDYGSSQGNNSIEPVNKVLSTLPDGAVASLIFEDTPFNDFSSLAKTVAQHFSAGGKDGRVHVAPSLVPLGFYQQVIPDGSADLGMAWSSLSYLSEVPTIELDAAAPFAEFAIARHKAFAKAAHPDLVRLLKLRAKEIREGGYFIAGIGGQKPAGEEVSSNMGVQPMQGALIRMVKEGILTMADCTSMANFPSHERTPDEMRAVLDDPEVKCLWELEVLDAKLIEHPAWARYQTAVKADPGKKDEAYRDYAKAIVANLTSSSGWFYADLLEKVKGPDWMGGEAFVDQLTQYMVEDCVAKHPDLKVSLWYNYTRLRRTSQKASI